MQAARSCCLLAVMHILVLSQPGKGQPARGCQAMSGGSPAPPAGLGPGKGELLLVCLFAPHFCIPTCFGSNHASTRRLAARGTLLSDLGFFKIRHTDTG